MIFDLNFTKLLVLGVIALIVFGPERLPAMAAQAGRAVRELRKMLDGAKSELRENLGPEFSQFDLADLNPKQFVRKHLVEEITGDGVITGAISDVRNAARGDQAASGANGSARGGSAGGAAVEGVATVRLAPGESPPYDAEAT